MRKEANVADQWPETSSRVYTTVIDMLEVPVSYHVLR